MTAAVMDPPTASSSNGAPFRFPVAPTAPPIVAQNPGDQSIADHLAVANKLMRECMEVSFYVTGLPKSKRAEDQFVEDVAKAADGEAESFSVSKRLLSSKHEAIDRLNQTVRAVEQWRNQWTFAMADGIDIEKASDMRKARGRRIIRVQDIEAFEEGLRHRAESIDQALQQLERDYGEILALERKRLGTQYNATDYPPADKLKQAVRISERSYRECQASVRLPPIVLKRASEAAAEIMNRTVEAAVAELTSTLTDTFSSLSRQLIERVCVRPVPGHALNKVLPDGEAEVLQVRTHAEDHNIPEGSVVVQLTWKSSDKEKITRECGPYTEEEYQTQLRPREMGACKRLDSRVVGRLTEQLEVFKNLRDRLGVYGAAMDETLDRLRELVHQGGRTPGKVIDQAKNSGFYRTTLRQALDESAATLAATAKEVTQVRRRISASVVAAVAAAQED